MSALCKSGCLGCENCDPTGERRERNDRNTSYFIGVHQSLDVLVRERDNAIAYAAQVEARLQAVEEERDKFKRHLEECHTRASQAEAEARRLRPCVESAMLWFKEHGYPELSWQYEAALTPPPVGPKENA